MNAVQLASTRYTCKAYDGSKTIDNQVLERLIDSLVLTPSAVNIQPWRFLVITNPAIKETITQSMTQSNAHNAPKVKNAHAVIVFGRLDVDEAHVNQVMQSESQAGRFANDDIKTARTQYCLEYLNALDSDSKTAWLNCQLYIALGQLLTLARLEGVDATPIEGFDKAVLDKVLNLPSEYGVHSVVMVALGVAGDDDFNAKLPKARLDKAQVVKVLD